LGRAFVFGMQPGVRVNSGSFRLDGNPTEPMEMLVRVVRVMQKAEQYLLLGRMLHAPKLEGAGQFAANAKNIQGHPPLPIAWPLVQATSWRAPDKSVAYALANLSREQRTVRLTAEPNGMVADGFMLTRLDHDTERVVADRISLPHAVELSLEPWAVCLLQQTGSQ